MPQSPADALPHVTAQRLCGKPGSLGMAVGRAVAQTVHLECGVRIFGHGFNSDAPDLQQKTLRLRIAQEPQKKCGVPQIVAVLPGPWEQLSPSLGTALKVPRFSQTDRARKNGAVFAAWPAGSRKTSPLQSAKGARVGMWSQSKMATWSPVMFLSAALMLPALACLLSLRVTWIARFFSEQPELLPPSIVQNVNF